MTGGIAMGKTQKKNETSLAKKTEEEGNICFKTYFKHFSIQ